MRKGLFFIIVFFAAVTAGYAQEGLKPRIAVFPLLNPNNDNQVGIISENVKKTAELTLRMLDRYEIVEIDAVEYENSNDWLGNYTVENSLDSIIFGRADMREDGSVFLEMSVFSRGESRVTMTEDETAETVFDIFDASDRLLISMIEAFSGMEHIGFGSIAFANSGEEGRYSVYIDNVLIGENIEELPKVLNGDRVLRIEQNRMLGPYIVKEEGFFLNEHEAKVIDFSVPGFTDEELLKISSLENYIDKNWEKKYSSKKIDRNFEKLEELFSVTDYSISSLEKKNAVLDKKKEWQVQKQKWGIQKGLSILDKRLGIAGFYGMNMSFPDFTSDDPLSEQKYEIGQKYGGSVSVNILKYLALQAEYNYTEFRAKIDRSATVDTTTVEIQEIPLILLLRMPNKVMSAYGGVSFMKKLGNAEVEIEDVATGDKTTVTEANDNIVKSDGKALILGALFEIPLNRSFLMIDFRYTKAEDDWSTAPNEELIPKYFSMTAGLGFKFF